jgi:hypothetical protein
MMGRSDAIRRPTRFARRECGGVTCRRMLICRAVVNQDWVFKRPFPWPHDPGLESAPIRRLLLRGAMDDVEVGTFLGEVCDTNHAGFDHHDQVIEDIEAIFDQRS